MLVTPSAKSCPICGALPENQHFLPEHAELFKDFHETVSRAVAARKFAVDDGQLQWQDLIECVLRCLACGTRFRLHVETFHGGGGEWIKET